jgi:nitronate monooxygenase
VLRTPLCDLLGIDHPIIQAGMAGASGPALVAAVSNAGGLGILGGAHMAPADLRAAIRDVRARTDRAFGVNLLLHRDVWPPVDAASIPAETVAAVHSTLNLFRARLGLPERHDRPATRPDHVGDCLEVMLAEGVRVFSTGMGVPGADLVERFHAAGATVMTMVATVEDAVAAAAAGVDVVVAQGGEAGGHVSTADKRATSEHAHIGLVSLVPEVVGAVAPPVVAAGGIATGAGVAAALALGAEGALVGTRFVATREAPVHEFWKRALVRAGSDDTCVSDAFTGLYARVVRNAFTRDYAASGSPTLTGYLQASAARDIVVAAGRAEDPAHYPLYAGQGVGAIRDVPAAAEVVESLVRDATDALRAVPRHAGTKSHG